MTSRLRLLARLGVAGLAVFATFAFAPARAEAIPFTLNSGSTLTALGGTHTLGANCAGFIGATASCPGWNGIPPVTISGTSTFTGTLNQPNSHIHFVGPWITVLLIDPVNGNCHLLVSASRTLTRVASPSRYVHNGTVGAYSFGACPPNTQTFVSAQLGPSPSSAPFNAVWFVS